MTESAAACPRPSARRRVGALGLVLLLSAHAPAAGAAEWVVVTSPHFSVHSDAGPGDAKRVALEFEVIRSVFETALPAAVSELNRPLIILALDDGDDLEVLFPALRDRRGDTPAGLFRRGQLQDHIVVRTDIGGADRYQIVYHEYFHLVTSLTTGRLPVWLAEGFAEVYSSAAVRGRTAEVGNHRPRYLSFLRNERLMPLEELVSEAADPHAGGAYEATRFYAQSWVLAHYLLLGDQAGEGQQRLAAYIAKVLQGDRSLEAFESTVGEVDDVARALRRYVDQSGFFAIRLDAPPAIEPDAFEVRDLTPAEVLTLQAGVLVNGTDPSEARPLIDEALALDPELPAAHETLGLWHLRRNRRAEAEAAFQAAVELKSDSYVPHYLGGILALEPSRVDEVRRLLRRAVELNPRFAPAHAVLAQVLASDAETSSEASRTAGRAVELEPSDVQHWVVWGEVLLGQERRDEARQVVGAARGWVRSADDRAALDELLERITEAAPR